MTAREHIEKAQQSLPVSTRGWAQDHALQAAQGHALVAIALALTADKHAAPVIDQLRTQVWAESKIKPAELVPGDIFVHRPSGQAWRWSGYRLDWIGGDNFDIPPAGETIAPKVGMVYTDEHGNSRQITAFSSVPLR